MTNFEIQNYESLIALKINFQVIHKKNEIVKELCDFCVIVMETNYCFT